jgi:hypothetical protein
MGAVDLSPARRTATSLSADAPARAPALMEPGAWQIADGVLFSVLSSLVLWSIIITSVYQALT